jgi:hypothetical protein
MVTGKGLIKRVHLCAACFGECTTILLQGWCRWMCRCDTTVHLSHAATRFLGDMLYDIFVSLNILIKAVRRLFKLPYWSLAAHVHCKVPHSFTSMSPTSKP